LLHIISAYNFTVDGRKLKIANVGWPSDMILVAYLISICQLVQKFLGEAYMGVIT
jgi:hypothetical protein